MWFPPSLGSGPRALTPRLLARLPERHRNPRRTTWADANRGGAEIDSFLEGPCFDSAGNLHVVDIPYGRIFRVGPTQWPIVAEYEGWPNGLAMGSADSLLVADYRHGLLSLDPASGAIAPLLETVASEGFRGLNDVTTGPGGQILVTDQGQTGLQDPSGRVWRLWPDGRIDRLIGNGPSPNGIVLNRAGTHCYVAMTRSCEVWRFALRDDAFVAKAGVFFRTPGGISGPDGMAVDAHDRLFVANPGHGIVWGLDPFGVPVLAIDCKDFGRTPTNICLAPDGTTLLITEADSASVLSVDLPGA